MIRKPLVSDAIWIHKLIVTEIPAASITLEDVQNWIEKEKVIVDDSEKAFLKWTEHLNSINIDLSITSSDSRGLGLSTILYSYVSYIFQKPVSFTVPAEGGEYVTRNAHLIRETIDDKGNSWRTYTKRT